MRKSHHHDDVIKFKHFLRYWPFVWGIHRTPVTGEFPTQRPVTRSFGDLRPRSLWRHCNARSDNVNKTAKNRRLPILCHTSPYRNLTFAQNKQQEHGKIRIWKLRFQIVISNDQCNNVLYITNIYGTLNHANMHIRFVAALVSRCVCNLLKCTLFTG